MPEHTEADAVARPRHVVILGGGFGGVAAARAIERTLQHDGDDDGGPGVRVTLVSRDDYFLFTPLLAEAVGGDVPPSHVAAPLHRLLHRTQVVIGDVTAVDLERRQVTVAHGPASTAGAPSSSGTLSYDQLVLALGSAGTAFGLPGVAERAMPVRTLADAVRLRQLLVDRLDEAADLEAFGHSAVDDMHPATAPEAPGANARARAAVWERASRAVDDDRAAERLLTVVVAGGGLAGVEVTGVLRDFLHDALRDYPTIPRTAVRIILVHPDDHLLTELGPSLGAYAATRLRARDVEVRLGVRVTGADDTGVTLSDGTRIETTTLVWTTGTAPHPLLAALGLPIVHGRVPVDEYLRLPGHDGVWAIGDCAAAPDRLAGPAASTAGPAVAPATAQHAERQGGCVGRNVLAALAGRPLVPYAHRDQGRLAAIGRHAAVAEIYGVRLHGLVAWGVWRMVYVWKLPRWEQRLRVVADWLLEAVLPADLVRLRVPPTAIAAAAGVPTAAAAPVDASRA